MKKGNFTPELFSQPQIEFLRRIGVRVDHCGTHQSVTNESYEYAIGFANVLLDGINKLMFRTSSSFIDEEKEEETKRPDYTDIFYGCKNTP
jgi:hypothetical protein